MAVSLRVNGHTFTSTADLDTPLLYILRNDLKLNGPKFGCGHGLCSSALSIGCGVWVPARRPGRRGKCGTHGLKPGVRFHHLIACGLIGEPVPPVITSGGPQKKNS
jgi:hypothetical protein